MPNITLPLAERNARLERYNTLAGANPIIRAYNGTRPLNGGAVTGGNTLLAELVGGATFGAVADGLFTANAITRDNEANANGTPTFIRVMRSDGTTWAFDIDTPGFPACVAGQPVEIGLLTIEDPNYDA